ncbi:MAG: hypothetical protein AB7G28_07110 [Pirellulales bacterium]
MALHSVDSPNIMDDYRANIVHHFELCAKRMNESDTHVLVTRFAKVDWILHQAAIQFSCGQCK